MWDTFKEYVKSFFSSRLMPVTLVYILLFAVLVNRLFQLQIIEGDMYASEAEKQTTKTKSIKATRGRIYDVNGKLLAYNKLSYNVTFTENDATGKLTSEEKNKMIYKMIKIIESKGGSLSVESFLTFDNNGKPVFTVEGNSLLRFKAEVYSTTVNKLTQEMKDKTAEDIYNFLRYDMTSKSPKFNIDKSYDDEMAMKILSVRYAMFINRYQKYQPITIATNVNKDTVAVIKEFNNELPGVDITEDTRRVYKKSKYFAHMLGYTGAISSEKLSEIKEKDAKTDYTTDDQIGLSGLENTFEDYLKGTKGSEKLTINASTSRVVSVSDKVDPVAGNDLYLTIDAELQEECYKLLEEHIAGVLIANINNSASAGSKGQSASKIKVPIYDVYNALIQNNLVDIRKFTDDNASALEKASYSKYKTESKQIMRKLSSYLAVNSTTLKKDVSESMADFLDYFYTALKNEGIVLTNQIDTSDSIYKQYADDKISLSRYLQYAISEKWLDLSKLDIGSGYLTTEEIYQELVKYGKKMLKKDVQYSKMVYSSLIYNYKLSGTDCCLIMFEQGYFKKKSEEYNQLRNGTMSSYSFIIKKIKSLEITPGDLGLEPCSGSIVVTDPNTGEVRAMVTYPGYDNNKMANKVDAEYYNNYLTQLASSPLINRPTQQALAPGSTFKVVSSIAGLEEGIITPYTHIFDKTVFDKIDHPARCWQSYSHGDLTVSTALEVSCNYFFYQVGYDLSGKTANGAINYPRGISRLKKYADMFGLTEKSGVELQEISPHFATTDAVRAAIGQDQHAYTPIQIARYLTTVANSGTCYDLTLVSKIKDVNGKVILNNKAKVRNKMDSISQSSWDAVHNGMGLVVNGPKSSIKSMFKKLNVKVAGKTGTAQQTVYHANHAYFMSYAPFSNPEIAVTCVIPNGYASSNAAQTARDVYKYYFSDKKSKDKKRKKVSGSVKMPESDSTHID